MMIMIRIKKKNNSDNNSNNNSNNNNNKNNSTLLRNSIHSMLSSSLLLLLFTFVFSFTITEKNLCVAFSISIQTGQQQQHRIGLFGQLHPSKHMSLSSVVSDTHENIEQNKREEQEIGYTIISKDKYDIVTVDLDNNRDYPIYIGSNYTDTETVDILYNHIKNNKKILLITNTKLDSLGYLQYYKNLLDSKNTNDNNSKKLIYTFVIPDGEEYKNLEILSSMLDVCIDKQLDRQSVLIAIGGGVIGDMVGFASAIYVRGINFIQIPTTVMSMVDSSVGGKTGINHPNGKNMIGSFHQPSCVFINSNTLQTLPNRELSSGISEIIKYGLIRDTQFFLWLENNMESLVNRNTETIRYAITRSCQNKASIVKMDEYENNNIRATLNLGHTFGHAIETLYGYGTYLHGEAVSIGIVMAATLSYQLHWLSFTDLQRIISLLQRAQLPISMQYFDSEQHNGSTITREQFINIMNVDKKVSNGQIRLILLKGSIGNCVFTSDFDYNIMVSVIDEFLIAANTKPTTTILSETNNVDNQILQQQVQDANEVPINTK